MTLITRPDLTLSKALAIRATYNDSGSELQPYSERNRTLQAIKNSPGSTATLADLQRQLGFDPRGHVNKLYYHGHVEFLGPPL